MKARWYIILWRLLWSPVLLVGILLTLLGVFLMHGKKEVIALARCLR